MTNDDRQQISGFADILEALGEAEQNYRALKNTHKKTPMSPTQAHQQIASNCRQLESTIESALIHFDKESVVYEKLLAMRNTVQSYLRYLVKLVYQS